MDGKVYTGFIKRLLVVFVIQSLLGKETVTFGTLLDLLACHIQIRVIWSFDFSFTFVNDAQLHSNARCVCVCGIIEAHSI